MLTATILLLAVTSVIGSPLDYFRFGITYNDTENAHQPFYVNLTSTGDFFLKAFGATLTNMESPVTSMEVRPESSREEPFAGGQTTQDSLIVITESPFDRLDVETNIV